MKFRSLGHVAATVALLAVCATLSACPGSKGQPSTDQARNNDGAKAAEKNDEAAGKATEKKEGKAPYPDGRPGSWPIAELSIPQGADLSQFDRPPVENHPFGSVAHEWALSFSYPNTWSAIVQHMDDSLSPLGYERLLGEKNDMTPDDPVEAAKKRLGTAGQKSYVSADRKTFVFLYYQGEPDLHSVKLKEFYRMQVLVFDAPQAIHPPSTTAPIA